MTLKTPGSFAWATQLFLSERFQVSRARLWATSTRSVNECVIFILNNLSFASISCIFVFFNKTFLKISNFVRMLMPSCSAALEGCFAWRYHLGPCSRRGPSKHLCSCCGCLGTLAGADEHSGWMSCHLQMDCGLQWCWKLLLTFQGMACWDSTWLVTYGRLKWPMEWPGQ